MCDSHRCPECGRRWRWIEDRKTKLPFCSGADKSCKDCVEARDPVTTEFSFWLSHGDEFVFVNEFSEWVKEQREAANSTK